MTTPLTGTQFTDDRGDTMTAKILIWTGRYAEGMAPKAQGWFCFEPSREGMTDEQVGILELQELGFSDAEIAQAKWSALDAGEWDGTPYESRAINPGLVADLRAGDVVLWPNGVTERVLSVDALGPLRIVDFDDHTATAPIKAATIIHGQIIRENT